MCTRKRIVIITNIPSPYRVDHYQYLQNTYKEYEFHIVFAVKKFKSELRQWKASIKGLENVYFLPNYTIFIKGRYDDRHIFITYGVGKILNKISPAAIVCMEYNPTSIQTMIWCKKKKIPYISLTDGTLYSERNINKIQQLSRKYIMANSNVFIASSTRAKEKIEAYTKKKKIYISYLSEDLEYYLQDKINNHGKTILYVGSLIERKGVDLLINAIAKMKTQCELNIAGNGPLLEELKQQSIKLHLDKKIHFLGYQQNDKLRVLYQNADLFVLPTREDCYGLVIMEAMCASIPVVISKYADGAYDLVDEEVTGIIIDPYNSDKFAQAMDRALNINRGTNKWGIAGNAKIRNFSFKQVSIPFIEAIKSVLVK